jgi:ribosome-binding protein aMBF1 (putative translation factor)
MGSIRFTGAREICRVKSEDAMTAWKYESDEQKRKMEEPLTAHNCGEKLALVREVSSISRRDLASVIGTSESTISRLETNKTLPTPDFMSRLSGLTVIGYYKFSQLSDSEKETISATVGATGGVAVGIGGAIGAVSVAGTAGLSAAGITSGLAAIGGTMLGGLAVVAAIPVAVGLSGYGLVKGIQAIVAANNLSAKEVDGRYEIVRLDAEPEQSDVLAN